MPLAYLSGIVPFHRYWQCLNIENDLCYFGIRSYEEEELELIRRKRVLVFESDVCQKDNLPKIDNMVQNYFARRSLQAQTRADNSQGESPYWISFDIDSVDAA